MPIRLSKPRVEPVSMDEYRRLQKELFDVDVPLDAPEPLNIGRTWLRNPKLAVAQRAYQQHLGTDGSLPHRDHELVILRIGWHCQAIYEFSQHTVFGKREGITDEEIKRVCYGPDAPGWSDWDQTLLRAVDELYLDHIILDHTWDKLAAKYSIEQIMDMVVLIGRYYTVSIVLNTLGVQLEPGRPGWPV